jgi:hypothetical protein
MRFAYADPPYLGQGTKHYGDRHDEAYLWDTIDAHRDLIDELVTDFPDGWALSLSSSSLTRILPLCPIDVRVAAWVKPFAAFKRNVRIAYTWEPVIFSGGRMSSKDGATPNRDHLAESITMRKGFPGAKPDRFNSWVLDLLGWKPGDELDDLFPGTGGMGRVVQSRSMVANESQLDLFEMEAH